MRTNLLVVVAGLLALAGVGGLWMLFRPAGADPVADADRRAAKPAVPAPAPAPATRGPDRGAVSTPVAVPLNPGALPPPVPFDAAGRTWDEAQRLKSGVPDARAAAPAAAADLEIASVLAEDAVNKSVAPMSSDERQELDRLLVWYRLHRGSAAADAEALRRKLMTAKTDAGQVTILPAIDGPNAPKPPPPPNGIRHAGWPHTVGDVSYWVTITENDSREYFDLVDLDRDAAGFLRQRILTLATAGPPKD